MNTNTNMVQIKNVSKAFGSTIAVKDANFALERGDFLTIVGPSGCGKTTLLRMIAGFETPNDGEILINDKQVESVPPYQRSIGMVFQKLALFPHMTAAENIAYPLKMRRFNPAEIPDRVETYLNLVQLDGLGNRRPHQLSGGQQQRVAIARALSFSPDLLLLDEPLSALDKKLREEMQLEFRRIQQELGVTTINVTHDQREALVMSDHIVVMDDGVIQQSDTPLDTYRKPSNRFVANFIGVTSILNGSVDDIRQGEAIVSVGGVSIRAKTTGDLVHQGDSVECAIRAEQIRFISEADPHFDNMVTGQITQRIFEGDRVVYEICVKEMNSSVLYVFYHDPALHKEFSVNESVRLGWNVNDMYVFPGEI